MYSTAIVCLKARYYCRLLKPYIAPNLNDLMKQGSVESCSMAFTFYLHCLVLHSGSRLPCTSGLHVHELGGCNLYEKEELVSSCIPALSDLRYIVRGCCGPRGKDKKLGLGLKLYTVHSPWRPEATATAHYQDQVYISVSNTDHQFRFNNQ